MVYVTLTPLVCMITNPIASIRIIKWKLLCNHNISV